MWYWFMYISWSVTVILFGLLSFDLYFSWISDEKSASSEKTSGSSSVDTQSGPRRAAAPGTGMPTNPFDFSAVAGLLNVTTIACSRSSPWVVYSDLVYARVGCAMSCDEHMGTA